MNNIYTPAPILFTSFQIKILETGRHHGGINVGYALLQFYTLSRADSMSCCKDQVGSLLAASLSYCTDVILSVSDIFSA